jgi:hypothetical protein
MGEGERIESGDTTPLRDVYIIELREHALTLVQLGYERMNRAEFSTAEEDEITGELARHMDEVTQANDAPAWAEHYTIKEQIRSHSADKLGKRRPIVDVEFERHKRGPRPRLRFEAKRLGRGVGVSEYTGSDGLGAFLDGHYSRTHDDAGMLGYVQMLKNEDWADKLAVELVSPSHKIVAGGGWRHAHIGGGCPSHTYCTVHSDFKGAHLNVFHVLLAFTE